MTKDQIIERQKADLRSVMSIVSGRRFIARMLEASGMWRSSFKRDRNATDFCEGSRAIGLALWIDLKKNCPEDLIKLLMEYDNEEPVEESGESEPLID